MKLLMVSIRVFSDIDSDIIICHFNGLILKKWKIKYFKVNSMDNTSVSKTDKTANVCNWFDL